MGEYGEGISIADTRRNRGQAKEADMPEPKGRWSGEGAAHSPYADVALQADRRRLSSLRGTCAERGKPVCFLTPLWEKESNP